MLKMLQNAPGPAPCKRWEPAKPQLGGLTAGGGQAGRPAALWVGSEWLGWGFGAPNLPFPDPFPWGSFWGDRAGRGLGTETGDPQPEVAVGAQKMIP